MLIRIIAEVRGEFEGLAMRFISFIQKIQKNAEAGAIAVLGGGGVHIAIIHHQLKNLELSNCEFQKKKKKKKEKRGKVRNGRNWRCCFFLN